MDSEIIGALITSITTIVAAIIGGFVAVKVKNMDLRAKETKTGKTIANAEKKTSRWLWGIGGALIGFFLVSAVMIANQNTFSASTSLTPTAVVEKVNTPSSTPATTSYFSDDFNSGTDFAKDYWGKSENEDCSIRLQNKQVQFNSTGINTSNPVCLISAEEVLFKNVGSMEASFSTASGGMGDYSIGIIEFSKGTFEDGSQNWIIQCGMLQIPNDNQTALFFNVHSTYPQGDPEVYKTIPASTGHWYKMELEIIPETNKIICSADGKVIGTYEGSNLVELHQENIDRKLLGYWSPHSQALFYADDVKLSQP